jgi:hypothetical protein
MVHEVRPDVLAGRTYRYGDGYELRADEADFIEEVKERCVQSE